jgi:hypothetical protein
MSHLHLSDEILMAFADGELDEPVAKAVEQAMLSDPDITKRIAGFLRSRSLARSALLREPVGVPPELYAAVQARISAFEAASGGAAESEAPEEQGVSRAGTWRARRLAMAASIVVLAGTLGYFAGREGLLLPRASGPMAHLEDPLVDSALSRNASGQEEGLPFGRMRVISTYRLANGSLCREFRLQAPAGAADAVACRTGGWTVTFAIASAAADGAYTPSDGSDLIATYLQNAGAGAPLLDAAEIKALAEHTR